MFIIENALLIISCIVFGVLFIDLSMHYLQSYKDPWMISLTDGQVMFQFTSLILCAFLGYTLGYQIGISLPKNTLRETIIIGCAFSFLASILCRGYVMLYFHNIRAASECNPV
jgi:hypothetical protein